MRAGWIYSYISHMSSGARSHSTINQIEGSIMRYILSIIPLVVFVTAAHAQEYDCDEWLPRWSDVEIGAEKKKYMPFTAKLAPKTEN